MKQIVCSIKRSMAMRWGRCASCVCAETLVSSQATKRAPRVTYRNVPFACPGTTLQEIDNLPSGNLNLAKFLQRVLELGRDQESG